MTTNTETVKVIFRADKKTGEIIAFFPELPGTNRYLYDCLSYQHVGQHGAASIDYYQQDTRPANMGEYLDLLKELEGIYGVGGVVTGWKITRWDLEQRRQAVKA